MLDKTKVTIEPAGYEDIDELLQVCRTLAKKSPNCPWTEDYPDKSTLMHDFSCGALKKVMYEDKIAGIVCFGEMNEFGAECSPEPELRICDMARFGLLPEYHGSGLSVQIILMGQAMINAEGYDVARLFVSKFQPNVIALYEIMGFHRVCDVLHVVGGAEMPGYIYEKRREDVSAADIELTGEVTTMKLSGKKTKNL